MKIMELNIPLLVAAGVALLLLVAFLVYRNLRDEKEYEEKIDDPHTLKKPPIVDKERQEKRF
jgi:hypothetical protein